MQSARHKGTRGDLTFNERVDLAIDHFNWLAARQHQGHLVVRAFEPRPKDGSIRLVSTEWFDNREPDFKRKLRRHIRFCLKKARHLFYGVNAFEIEDAKAKYVAASRIAQVDADNVRLPVLDPQPTRIIQTSPGNHQFLYELDEPLRQDEVEAVSSYLTNLVGGEAFQPTLIIADTAADTFGGNENFRSEVRAFVSSCCGRLAHQTGAAFLLLAHPSQAGLNNKRGDGGSTAWNNSMRSRLYLRFNDDAGVDDRVLELPKVNHGQRLKSWDLFWEAGAFRLASSASKRTSDPNEPAIIAEVARAFDAEKPWSAHPQAQFRWLGQWIMKEFHKSKAYAGSIINKLMRADKLVEVDYDPHRHRKALCTPAQHGEFMRAKERR